MGTESGISFLSPDPALNPLLRFDLSGSVSTTWALIWGAVLLAGLLWGAWSDLFRGRHVPNALAWVGLSVGVVAVPLFAAHPLWHYATALGMALIFGAGAMMGGVGMGDVKLYVVLALLLGIPAIAIVFLSHVLALLVAGLIILLQRRKPPVPMVPFIFAATVIVLIGGHAPARAGEVIPLLASAWVWWGGGALALAAILALGARERRHGVLDLAGIAADVAAGRSDGVIYAPRVRLGAGELTVPLLSAGQIDRIVGEGLSHEEGTALDGGEGVLIALRPRHDQERPVQVHIAPLMESYLLHVTPWRDDAGDLITDDAPAAEPPVTANDDTGREPSGTVAA